MRNATQSTAPSPVGHRDQPPLTQPCTHGHFAEDGMSFVITDPATPRAFDNFLWNDAIMSNVHQTGVGTCDVQVDDREAIQLFTGVGRICDIDVYGRDHLMSRLVYVRDNDTGEFWNVGWEPVCRAYDAYACEHGLGYSRITSETCGIRTTLLLTVPAGNAPVEQWKLDIANPASRPRNLSVFVYNQYALSYMWGFESYGDMLYRGAWYDPACNAVIVQKHPYVAPHDYLTAFLAANRAPDGYDGSRRFFVGNYATLAAPRAVVEGTCTNTPGSCEATIAALQFNLHLAPAAAETVEMVNGLATDPEQVAALADRHLGSAEKTLAAIRNDKRELAARNNVRTPDVHFDRMVNGWLKQQCLFGATWCRWGYMGYRDIVQHAFGVSSFAPGRTREILLEALSRMSAEGTAPRGWNPLDTKPYSDSTVWLVYALTAYLKETGDFDLLNLRIPYTDEKDGTVLDHIMAALAFFHNNRGRHGLCLIKFGDWNDSLTNIGREGRGESVWLSMAYTRALEEMAELLTFLENTETAADCARKAAAMRRAVQQSAWDGAWFVRCLDDRGSPVGSSQNTEGRIYLNAQSWAVIADIADSAQQDALFSACREHLLTEVGYRLLAPPYLTRDDHIGRISYLEPGICENGTIYSHGNAFLFLAHLMAGRADEAYETLRRLTPGYIPRRNSPKTDVPPYVYANGYYAPEHRNNPLQAEFTWITGSVAWWYNAILDFMFGIRREYNGLTVRPTLPSDWTFADITRTFRGRTFAVSIERTGTHGVQLNGTSVDGDFIPLSACKTQNILKVTL